jgi:DNA-binding CsgD family transcriptional regulator
MVELVRLSGSVWERFWKYVQADPVTGCWNWTGCKYKWKGEERPVMKLNGKTIKPYRLIMNHLFGAFSSSVFVCHHCDNPICVNPKHLFLGTAKDNVRDCHRKGRNADFRGEKHPRVKLTAKNVIEIRQMLIAKDTCVEIAKRFGIAASTVSKIKQGTRWSS